MQGFAAHFRHQNAEALVLYEASLRLNGRQPDAAEWRLKNRMARGAALRNLGALEQARDELTETASVMRQGGDTSATILGRCLFERALCEFRLGLANEAKATVAESLQVYGDAPENSPVAEELSEQSQRLQADLENGAAPPPRVKVDVEAELQRAREWFAATQKLATLPLDQPTGELFDQMLGPAPSIDDVLKDLDEQYRKAGKPDIWFLPLDEPISPHLDELLGPIDEEP
jgi:tetratricopeptide (TPR) repeat protein